MYKCVPQTMHYILDKYSNLDEILEKLMMYTSNEDMYLSKAVESIKKRPKSTSFKEDKLLLAFYDVTLSNITKINSAYNIDFATAQLIVNKLSLVTMMTKYIDSLIELWDKTGDTHKVNNYLATMEQIIIKCKLEINNMLDVDEMDEDNTGGHADQASVYQVQTQDRGQPCQHGQERKSYMGL